MTESNTDDDRDEQTPDDYLRNDGRPSFDAHVFARVDVEVADGEVGEQSSTPVASICSRTTAYGPFREVDDETDTSELCSVCANRLDEVTDA